MPSVPIVRAVALIEATRPHGPARNLIDFACRARQAGSDVPPISLSIVTFHRGALEPPNRFVAAAREAGLDVDVIQERRRFDLGVLGQLREVFERRRPDVVQSHNVKSHLLARLTGIWRSRPWIAFLHGYTATDLKDRLYNQFDRWSLGAAFQAVTVCEPFRRHLERCGVAPDRIAVQHNPVQPFEVPPDEVVAAAGSRLGIPPGAGVILSAGRLSREKGHRDLLSAVAALRRAEPDLLFRVVILGEGPERHALEKQRAVLGLAGLVLLPGHVSDVRPFFSMANLVVLPSHSEGSPNVMLEAMSAGVPVVATSVGGVPEIAEHGKSALLVSVGDIGALALSMTRLLRDPSLGRSLAAAAGDVVRVHHQPEVHCRSLVELYIRVLKQFAQERKTKR